MVAAAAAGAAAAVDKTARSVVAMLSSHIWQPTQVSSAVLLIRTTACFGVPRKVQSGWSSSVVGVH